MNNYPRFNIRMTLASSWLARAILLRYRSAAEFGFSNRPAGRAAGTPLPPAVAALWRTGSQLIHHRWSLTTTPIISRGHPRGDGRVFHGLLGYKSLENFGCTSTWQRWNFSFRQYWWDRAVWLQCN